MKLKVFARCRLASVALFLLGLAFVGGCGGDPVGEIEFVTELRNGFGQIISPFMTVQYTIGEDARLDAILAERKDCIANYRRIAKTGRKSGNSVKEALAGFETAQKQADYAFSIINLDSEYSKKMVSEQQYDGNSFTLTEIPAGTVIYIFAYAQWANGEESITWCKKIKVDKGKNRVMLVNDSSAFQVL